MSFAIYAGGLVILLGGLAYGEFLMHVPAQWIAVSTLVMLGASVLVGVKVTRHRDPA